MCLPLPAGTEIPYPIANPACSSRLSVEIGPKGTDSVSFKCTSAESAWVSSLYLPERCTQQKEAYYTHSCQHIQDNKHTNNANLRFDPNGHSGEKQQPGLAETTEACLGHRLLTTPVVSPPMAEPAAAVLMRIGLAMILLPFKAGDMRRSGAVPLENTKKQRQKTKNT